MEKTPWFTEPPERPVVYELQVSWPFFPFAYWTGEYWSSDGATPQAAEELARFFNFPKMARQDFAWRGILKTN